MEACGKQCLKPSDAYGPDNRGITEMLSLELVLTTAARPKEMRAMADAVAAKPEARLEYKMSNESLFRLAVGGSRGGSPQRKERERDRDRGGDPRERDRDRLAEFDRLVPTVRVHGHPWPVCELPPPGKSPAARQGIGTELTQRLVFLTFGGSNMAGRAAIPGRDVAGYTEHAYMLDAKGRWVPAQEPANPHDGRGDGAGPQLAFARRLLEPPPGTSAFLVPCAVGGSKIDDWQQDGVLLQTAIKRLKLGAEACNGVICGMVWHLGEEEANRSENDARLVGGKVEVIATMVRKTLGIYDLPFICGQLGPFLRGEAGRNAWLVNGGLEILAGRKHGDGNTYKRTKVDTIIRARCCTAEQTTSDDGVHFDLRSQQVLGRRYAEAWWSMESHSFPRSLGRACGVISQRRVHREVTQRRAPPQPPRPRRAAPRETCAPLACRVSLPRVASGGWRCDTPTRDPTAQMGGRR